MEHVAAEASEIKIPSEPAPDPKRDNAIAVLTRWAEDARDAHYDAIDSLAKNGGRAREPEACQEWCDGGALQYLARIPFIHEGEKVGPAIQRVRQRLRGVDVDIAIALERIEARAPESVVRVLVLLGFVASLYVRDDHERTVARRRFVDFLRAREANDLDTICQMSDELHSLDAPPAPDLNAVWSVSMSLTMVCDSDPWFAGSSRALVLAWDLAMAGGYPNEQRWIAAVVEHVLCDCLAAISDAHMPGDPHEIELAVFLATGELPIAPRRLAA